MLMLRRHIGRYLYRKIFTGILLALVIIALVLGLVAFVELSRSVGRRADVTVFNLLWLTVLQTPGLVEETIPFTFLFGMMWAFFHLNRGSELIAMRAAGFSAWHFLTPAFVIAFFAGIGMTLVYNPFANRLTTAFEAQKRDITETKNSPSVTQRDIWLREGSSDGQRVIHIRSSNLNYNYFYDVTIYNYSFTTKGLLSFSHRYDAKSMFLRPGFWSLEQIAETRPGEAPSHYDRMSLLTPLVPEDVRRATGNTQYKASFWVLPNMIKEMRKAGFSPQRLVLQWYSLLAMPLTLIAMAVIAACVSLRFTRSGGVWRLFITGGAFGFFLYFIKEMLQAFSAISILSPFLAVWSPPLFALLCGLAFLCFAEDG